MDGSFTDLNPDFIASEVDDYSKELYKLMKVFINRHKKQLAQQDERDRERKRSIRRRSTATAPAGSRGSTGRASAPDPAVPPPAVPRVTPPAAISVCEKVITQLSDFKVHFSLLLFTVRFLLVSHNKCTTAVVCIPHFISARRSA